MDKAKKRFEHRTAGPLRVTPRPGHSFDDLDVEYIEAEGGVVDRYRTKGSGASVKRVISELEEDKA